MNAGAHPASQRVLVKSVNGAATSEKARMNLL